MIATALSLRLLLSAVSLSTPTVPATGHAQALITLDKPAMIRLTATSASGTACEVVDKVRGPFAQDGVAGRSNCKLDLLLDQGSYKVRLDSARRGKGKAKLSAVELTELNPAPPRLVPGSVTNLSLKSGQQASFWLHSPARGGPRVRISGRTAGDVRLWRNGQWVENQSLTRNDFSPEPGRPIHEWWVASTLEEGDYLVTVYGTQEYVWPGGAENDALEIATGFRDGPVELSQPFTLGRSGVAAIQIPAHAWTAMLSLDAPPDAAVELDGDVAIPGGGGSVCHLEKKVPVPQCAISLPVSVEPHALIVRGPSGTKGVIEWAPAYDGQNRIGGYYGSAATMLPFRATPGLSLVALHDLPTDTDAAPLGCMVTRGNGERVATDFPQVGDGKMLDAQFNYDGRGSVIWFDVKRSGRYRIETTGGRKSHCELYRFSKSADLELMPQAKPSPEGCQIVTLLNAGQHQLSLLEGLEGIEHLVIVEDGRKNATAIPLKAACLLPTVPLGDGDYVLNVSRLGSVATRGLIVDPLPLRLDQPLHLTLDAHQKISLPLAGGTPSALVRSAAGAPFGCGSASSSAGQCTVTGGALELENPGDAPIAVTAIRPPSAPPPAPQLEAASAPTIQPLPTTKADAPVYFDFAARQSHSLLFDVEKAGLYNVSTQGLLATTCVLRTPVIPDVAQDTSGGRGRNCLVAGYLRPGRYMMTISTVGESRGRAAVLLTRRPLRELGGVAAESDAFFRVDPGDLVQQRLVVPAPGSYALATTAQGAGGALRCRLDDLEGWPLAQVPTSCTQSRRLREGCLPVGAAAAHGREHAPHAPGERGSAAGAQGLEAARDRAVHLVHGAPQRSRQRRVHVQARRRGRPRHRAHARHAGPIVSAGRQSDEGHHRDSADREPRGPGRRTGVVPGAR